MCRAMNKDGRYVSHSPRPSIRYSPIRIIESNRISITAQLSSGGHRRRSTGYWSSALWILLAVLINDCTAADAQITERFECRLNGCCDQHEWCAFWASIGECASNKVWMAPNCQLACRTCSGRPRGGIKPTKTSITGNLTDATNSSSGASIPAAPSVTDLTGKAPGEAMVTTTASETPSTVIVVISATSSSTSSSSSTNLTSTTNPSEAVSTSTLTDESSPTVISPTESTFTTSSSNETPSTAIVILQAPTTSIASTEEITVTGADSEDGSRAINESASSSSQSSLASDSLLRTLQPTVIPLPTTESSSTVVTLTDATGAPTSNESTTVVPTTTESTTTAQPITTASTTEATTTTSTTSSSTSTSTTTSPSTTTAATTSTATTTTTTATTTETSSTTATAGQQLSSSSTASPAASSASPPSFPQSPATASPPSPPTVAGLGAGVVKLQGVIKLPKPVSPTGPKLSLGNNPQRCEEIRRGNLSNTIMLMVHEGLMNEKEDTSFRRVLSTSDIFASNTQFGCAPQQDFTDCGKNICYNLRYRTMDGSCNNFDNPFFGAAATAYLRLKPPTYDDGIAAPTGSTKAGRPSARDASRFLLSSSQLVLNEKLNALTMQFGQFITHDITKTSLLPSDKCIGCTEIVGRCTPIKADQFDPRFGCQTPPCCLSFTRAASVCGTGVNSPRAQLNENTAFLDGSMIYGSSMTDTNRLRDGALLKSTAFNGHNFLPFNQQQCSGPTSCNANFDAGDNRITIFVGLAAFHTLFLREHNRIAAALQQGNPSWTADRVFHESRKIVGAELQAIAYKEWLPEILGNAFATNIGPYNGYDSKLNPSIASEFTHAAMRFGHGMIQESYNRIDTNGQPIPQGGMKFEDGVLKPQRLLFEGGVDPLLRGMITTQLKKPQRVTTVVTERMFGSTDLAAINIQRGRDAGIPGYNEVREFCGMKKAATFNELSAEILDANVRKNLETGYKETDSIDLYVGALLEDPVVGGMVGPTIACIIGDQFKRIRNADRFWYQNPATFTPEQLVELEKVTIARILCDNADNLQTVPPTAFHVPTGSNSFASCSSVPTVDLSKWSE